ANDDFGNYEGWLRYVLTHELAHVVHLDEARGIPGAARKVFGRVPIFFPHATTPERHTGPMQPPGTGRAPSGARRERSSAASRSSSPTPPLPPGWWRAW